jgi:hypothetical protein
MSGDALKSTQLCPSELTAIEDCVRRWPTIDPLLIPAQLAQLQFH